MEEQDFFEQKPTKATGMLNVLTILTFIGSGFGLIFSAAMPWITKFSLSMMEKANEMGTQLTPQQIAEMEEGKKGLALLSANMTPIVASGVIGAIGCIVGAVMMRSLKQSGLYIYTIFEFLPLIVGFVLMGTAQFTGVSSYIMSIGIPVLFTILYFTQKKQLINK